ncbi:MAG: phosphonoacetaldehyde reductase [Nanoarchaeota archaeon]
MTQKTYFGFGSIHNLKNILKKHNPSSIFLLTGKSSYEKSGAKKKLGSILHKYDIVHFNQFQENPKIENVVSGIKIFKQKKCDFVIAVGGGSSIDMAKSINVLSSNSGNPEAYIKKEKKLVKKGRILVAIPTTAGSGSEATRFAVVYIGKTKHSLEHEFILPDYAIVDPQFTMSLPRNITATTGMDALSQAIESYWSVNSTSLSKKYAGKAIRLIIKNLPIAVNKHSKEIRGAMAKAANLAGKAINITRTTAPHSVSYPITSYFGVPHGHALGLTLPSILEYNSQVTKKDLLDKRGVTYVKKTINEIVVLLGAESVKETAKKITNLMTKIGLNKRLNELGIKTDKDIKLIIENGFNADRVKNNPRRLTEEALRVILYDIR